MCHLITAISSKNISLTDINSFGKHYDLHFDTCKNDHIENQLNKTEVYLYKKSNSCDCGTGIGEAYKNKTKNNRFEKSEIDKLIKKGWSVAKINRFIEDRKKLENKVAQENKNVLKKQNNELDNYVQFLLELFNKTNIEKFGILLHSYSKERENENFKIKSRITKSFKSLTIIDFKTLEEDNLLCLTR